MRRHSSQRRLLLAGRVGRDGFTLIELLVVIGILLLLATLAVAAYRGVTSADRVSGAARNFKTSLEGARSRAIADGQPRGIREITPDLFDGCRHERALGQLEHARHRSAGHRRRGRATS